MDTPPTDAPPADESSSLLVPRIVAAVGAVVAVMVVVAAFSTSLWLGFGVLFVSPAIPMVLVLAVEAVRR